MMKPLLGVVGGMGPQVTACFYEKLHTLQSITVEQEYFDILVYSIPTAPDRTAYITGKSTDSPLESLIHAARTLESAGASCIALPCVTSHFFYADLVKAVNIPVLNILDETAGYAAACGFGSVCLLATDGTVKGGAFHAAFAGHGIEVSLPALGLQSDLMSLIYDIKRGAAASELSDALETIISAALKTTGAEAVVLGCTELCISAKETPGVINTLEVLARASLYLR